MTFPTEKKQSFSFWICAVLRVLIQRKILNALSFRTKMASNAYSTKQPNNSERSIGYHHQFQKRVKKEAARGTKLQGIKTFRKVYQYIHLSMLPHTKKRNKVCIGL